MFHKGLFPFVLTHQSIAGQQTLYDVLGRQIQDAIQSIQRQCVNAQILNAVFVVNEQLVVAQIYIERKNGFAPTDNEMSRYGTTPTLYNVQVRFPFGLNINLDGENIFIPSGEFEHVLVPYKSSSGAVKDDVIRGTSNFDIIYGDGVIKRIQRDRITFTYKDQDVTLPIKDELGVGFKRLTETSAEYDYLEDYRLRLKQDGVYALFYSGSGLPADSRIGLMRYHPEYPGYTHLQNVDSGVEYESRVQGVAERKRAYKQWVQAQSDLVLSSAAGQTWVQSLEQSQTQEPFVLNMTVANGVMLIPSLRMPVTRLRDYQAAIFMRFAAFIEAVNRNRSLRNSHAATINLSVGGGKTYLTYVLLVWIRQLIQTRQLDLSPAYCLAPDAAVANVTVKTVTRQGLATGFTATAVTNKAQMPNAATIDAFTNITQRALREAEGLYNFLMQGLQERMLAFCRSHSLHPFIIINCLYDLGGTSLLKTYKESIDAKRIYLLVEGQKNLLRNTGMQAITALRNLLQIFETLRESANQDSLEQGLIAAIGRAGNASANINIRYDQDVNMPNSMKGCVTGDKINVTKIDAVMLRNILIFRNTNARTRKVNYVAVRNLLVRMACLNSTEAALLLANSGGLGNTNTEVEMQRQIEMLLKPATQRLQELLQKNPKDDTCHYEIYLFLNDFFSTIPDAINVKKQLNQKNIYAQAVQSSVQLVNEVCKWLQQQLAQLAQVEGVDAARILVEEYALQPNITLIEASHQLAGFMGLALTGNTKSNGQAEDLLLGHVPVFSPEGFASYIEYLASLEGKVAIAVQAQFGLFAVNRRGAKITKNDIKVRLQEIFTTLAIADEVHKEAYRFLYDPNNQHYQRIDAVTRRLLNQRLLDILPHRIGMSGTINDVANRAFGPDSLYKLGTQAMMRRGMVKVVNIESNFASAACREEVALDDDEYAKCFVVDYFVANCHLNMVQVVNGRAVVPSLYELSQGLVFGSDLPEQYRDRICYYFNLLVKARETGERQEQAALLQRINAKRQERVALLNKKLCGEIPLDTHEVQGLERAQQQNTESRVRLRDNVYLENFVGNIGIQPLVLYDFQAMQLSILLNYLLALYLEFILSKSGSPKELSEIIGLQNKLADYNYSLLDIAKANNLKEAVDLVKLCAGVDEQLLTDDAAKIFIAERLRNSEMAGVWCGWVKQHKNEVSSFAGSLSFSRFQLCPYLNGLITCSRDEFESGTSMLLFATPAELTGYSHEPIGNMLEVPNPKIDYRRLSVLLGQERFIESDVEELLPLIHFIARTSRSYDAKNQAGGRAIRTPYGQVRYIEYLSDLNAFLARHNFGEHIALSLFQVEVSFNDIFTFDSQHAEQIREKTKLNRQLLLLLDDFYKYCGDNRDEYLSILCRMISFSLLRENVEIALDNQYRMALFIAMTLQPELACNYLNDPEQDLSCFDDILRVLTTEYARVKERVPELDELAAQRDAAVLRDSEHRGIIWSEIYSQAVYRYDSLPEETMQFITFDKSMSRFMQALHIARVTEITILYWTTMVNDIYYLYRIKSVQADQLAAKFESIYQTTSAVHKCATAYQAFQGGSRVTSTLQWLGDKFDGVRRTLAGNGEQHPQRGTVRLNRKR